MRLLISLATLLTGAALLAAPAFAQEIGTATAVNPSSQATPPGGATGELRVGARIVHKERIQTTPSGTAQLLFLDKSTLSIAPNTDIVIDDYVYNPNERSGNMAASLAKGTLRFVGGELSHSGQATITTPVAVIGIRGGTHNISYDGAGLRVIALYGTAIIKYNGGTIILSRSGFAVTITNNGTVIGPERVTAAEIHHYLVLLTSHVGQDGGVPGLTNAQITDYGLGWLQGFIDPYHQPINTGQWDPYQIGIQGTQNGSGRGPKPTFFYTNGH